MPYLHHEHCLMLYCCKAFAYNIKALRGVSASERAMSSILSCPPLVEMGWRRNETDG